MTESSKTNGPHKLCFVTIGATASFNGLLSAVLKQPFLEALREAHYTHLLVQYGKEGKLIFDKFVEDHPPESEDWCGLTITGFDFNPRGLGTEMQAAKGNPNAGFTGGVVISHAGKSCCYAHQNSIQT